MAISRMRSLTVGLCGGGVDGQTAFDRFVRVLYQLVERFALRGEPEMAGTSAQKLLSSAWCMATFIFIVYRHSTFFTS
jgi:hypothetical protein